MDEQVPVARRDRQSIRDKCRSRFGIPAWQPGRKPESRRANPVGRFASWFISAKSRGVLAAGYGRSTPPADRAPSEANRTEHSGPVRYWEFPQRSRPKAGWSAGWAHSTRPWGGLWVHPRGKLCTGRSGTWKAGSRRPSRHRTRPPQARIRRGYRILVPVGDSRWGRQGTADLCSNPARTMAAAGSK